MSPRTAVIVWSTAVVLAIAALLSRTGQGARGSLDGTAAIEVPALDVIRSIELQRGDGTWRFERTGEGHWWQRAPFVHRADGARLMEIPELLSVLRAVAMVDLDDRQAGVLGLSLPDGRGQDVGRLVFEGADGSIATIHLGRTGVGGRGWIRLGDEASALVIDDDLHAMVLQDDPRNWRDHRLLPTVDADARSVHWVLNGERIELERSGRQWRFASPVETRAGAGAVANQLAALAGARFTSVLLDDPGSPGAFGLEPPVARIEVVDADEGLTALLIGDRLGGSTGDRYAMIEGTPSIVRLDQETVASLTGNPVDLVDKTGSGASPVDVRSIRILRPEGTLQIIRSLDDWTLADGGALDAAAVEALLRTLTAVEGTEVTLVETYPRDLEQATVVLEGADGHPIDTVRVLQEPMTPEGPGRWGLENGDGVIRILPPGTWIGLTRSTLGG